MHYFSDRCDPFKTVLPQLIKGASREDESVFVVESPLSEIINETIALNQHPDCAGQVVVEKRQRDLFEAVKL